MIFSESFYNTVLCLLVKGDDFAGDVIEKIPESFFENKFYKKHFKIIKRLYKEYGMINKDVYIEEAGSEAEVIMDFSYLKLEKYVVKNIYKFIYVAQLKKTLDFISDECGKDFRDINDVEIKGKLATLETYSMFKDEKPPLDYYKDVVGRIVQTSNRIGIPTGIPDIDRRLFGGGLCSGELGIILALPNRGKSATLINLVVAAATYGKSCAYITLEMSEELIAHRIDMRITGFTSEEVKENAGVSARKIYKFQKITQNQIAIKGFQSEKATVSDIRNFLLKEKKKGNKIDFLVVDYADILTTKSKHKRDDNVDKEIYTDLRELANEFKIPIWTASQSNRKEAEPGQVIDMTRFSNSFAKGFIGDVVLSINQDDKQLENNKAVYYFAKNRNEAARYGVELYADWSRMIITDFNSYDLYYSSRFGNRKHEEEKDKKSK